MNLGATRIRLDTLTKELRRAWDETKTDWRDQKAEEFERAYLEELARQVEKTTGVIEKLDHLLAKVKDDCE
jgi:DNA repair exonuclease SbcCD ATPase subunit